ncbi:MAG: hypothetical protein Q9160_002951 [Pyrenula sp. 1 TL-2023]
MSVTATQNPTTYSFARTLADYNIYHSSPPRSTSAPASEPNAHPYRSAAFTSTSPSENTHPPAEAPNALPSAASTSITDSVNPVTSGWLSSHRRIPPHRPINHDLDVASRRSYL